jgi:outer membrane lipoprotein-sorting protein
MSNILLCIFISLSAPEILAKIDGMRNPAEAYRLNIRVSMEEEKFNLQVYVKGTDKSVIKFTSPAKWRGRIILLNGTNMWFYTSHSRPIRIAPIHRLVGGLSNADVASAYFSQEYHPIIVNEDGLQYTLELTPKRRGVAYGRVKLWVRKRDCHLLRGEFYSLAGRLLKEVYYKDYQKIGNGEYYPRMEVIDKLKGDEKTTMEFLKFETTKLADYMFNKDYLPYFK